jgi:chromosome segregation ATPase
MYKIISLSLQLSEANKKIRELEDKNERLEAELNESEDKCKDVMSTLILLDKSVTRHGDSKKTEHLEKELVSLMKVFSKCIMAFAIMRGIEVQEPLAAHNFLLNAQYSLLNTLCQMNFKFCFVIAYLE